MNGEGTPGADFLLLDRREAPPRGVTEWLVGRVRAAVADGRLPAGAPLPPSRRLAAELGCARGVVVEAYRRLVDEGLVAARVGAGTVVVDRVLVAPPPPPPTRTSTPTPAPAPSTPRGPAPGAAPRLPDRSPGIELDLSPGLPDLSAFPRAVWLRAERAVLAGLDAAALDYGDPRGDPALRVAVSEALARTRGVRVDPAALLVVGGVAQALALLGEVLVRRGTPRLAVEDPGSRGARDALAYRGLDLVPVPVDADGLDVDALERTGAPTVLVTPAHQFPTGVVLAPGRRRRLVEWATAAPGRLVVEDDYDAEHRYDRAPVPALQALAPDVVAYAGSVSKSWAPGLRLGWLAPPATMLDELVAARRAADLGSPVLPQRVLAHLLTHGDHDRHLRRVRLRQRLRRDALVAALATHLPGARVQGSAAGLHLLALLPGLPPGVDDVRVAAAAASRGVRVQPLSWHRHAPGPAGLVIGYAAQTPDRLEEAVRRLGEAVAATVAGVAPGVAPVAAAGAGPGAGPTGGTDRSDRPGTL